MTDLRTAVVAGGSGWIGAHLQKALAGRGVDVRTIGRARSNDATWDDHRSLVAAVDGADLVVNLAGRSVSCRYGKRNADEIFSSRVQTTAALGRAIAEARERPALWANASTGTIYRDARDRPMREGDGELGTGFSVSVARAWEQELFDSPAPVRKIALRMAIVLGAGGGALNPFINLTRLGLGGPMGDGGQMFSWVHLDDVTAAILHLHEHDEIDGPVNIASPSPVTNAQAMQEVRAALGRSRGLPTPAWLLELGARIIRTETELVLKSRWVDPAVLTRSGFVFAHPDLAGALRQIASLTPSGLLPVALG